MGAIPSKAGMAGCLACLACKPAKKAETVRVISYLCIFPPTTSPMQFRAQGWKLGTGGQNCNTVCSGYGGCNSGAFASVVSETYLRQNVQGGVACSSYASNSNPTVPLKVHGACYYGSNSNCGASDSSFARFFWNILRSAGSTNRACGDGA